MIFAAAVLTVAAVLMVRPSGRWVVRWRLRLVNSGPPGARKRPGRWLSVALIVGACSALVAFDGSFPHLLAGFTAIGVFWVWLKLRRNARESAARQARARQVAEIVDSLAAELGAGILAVQALQHLAVDLAMLDGAAAASRMGGDVPGALRAAARQPGAEGLDELAAAWEVSERSGAPMARVLDRLGDGIRDERETQREITAGLGPARATARLMAVLPLFGLGMGVSMGARPVHILLDTVVGSLCLLVGATLACAGVWWVDHIAAHAERA